MPTLLRRIGWIGALIGALAVEPGCLSGESVHGSALAFNRAASALTSGELLSANGTYGAGCHLRSGSWSVGIATGAVLDHSSLSVIVHDVGCALTLTELETTAGLVAAAPAIPLTTSYPATPSVFGSPVAFYANAQLSTATFGSDFVLSILFSDDPLLVTADNIAVAIPPTVIAMVPLAGAVNISINTRPTATFSYPMDSATITNVTFTLSLGGPPVTASVAYDVATQVATLTPGGALALDTLYTVTVTTGAKDIRLTPLASDFSWTFTTAACSQGFVDLGTAANFAVLGSSTVTNTGPTVVTGDLGVSPGTAITGFPPGTVSGTIDAADAVALQASTDLVTAYNDAATRTVCPIALPAEIGGETLTPGLYAANSTLGITTGNVTLDAVNQPDAVFVIQIGSTLAVGSAIQVNLINGAQAGNVFWQVGSSATLGSTSSLVGNVLANQTITLVTGASLDGRALAETGAVILDSNTITEPVP